MYNPYKYVFNRLNKLNKTIENLVADNLALREANEKLRRDAETYLFRLAASERVFESLKTKDDVEPS